MSATVEARRLTESHRLAQARLGAGVVQAMDPAWSLLDPHDLDGTFERWFRVASPIVTSQRRTSATLAANYLAAFRGLEIGDTNVPTVLADAIPSEQVLTSLTVTGPAKVKSAAARGASVEAAMTLGRVQSARAALRLVLGGGRDTITESTAADRRALGWARATSGRPCAFCAMLASRGPVYTEESVRFQAHDACSCTAEPVYREDAAWPSGSDRWRSMWGEAEGSDGDTLANFRALVAAA